MYLLTIDKSSTAPQYGGKINGLIELTKIGINVPKAAFISEDVLATMWRPLVPELENQDFVTANEVTERLQSWQFPAELVAEINQFMQPNQTYIVRSSGKMEDHELASFAGQYESVSDCHTVEDILIAMKKCIASLFQEKALHYWQVQQLPIEDMTMSVIIQEQVTATVSGVAFSINPTEGQDQQFSIEVVEGAGEQLVSGQVSPEQIQLDWFGSSTSSNYLTARQLVDLQKQLLHITTFYGYPIDVEFCFEANQLFFLQVRPITTVSRKIKRGNWTNANFRDGGVAAQPCPALMWSLYRMTWQTALERFLIQHKLYPSKQVPALATYHFARPYWNIGVVKEAMAQIPRYVEREFDDELGIYKNYQGDGYKSRFTFKTINHLLRVAIPIQQSTKQQRNQASQKHQELLSMYHSYNQKLAALANGSLSENEQLWEELVEKAYLQSETTYFWQVFINTIQLSMNKTQLLKKIPLSTFFQLIARLGEVSHVRPLKSLLEIVDIIQKNYVPDWQENDILKIANLLKVNPEREDAKKIQEFQENFGYHSTRELNLLVPSYSEDQCLVIEQVKDYLMQPEKAATAKASFQEALSEEEIEQLIAPHVKTYQQKKIKKDIQLLRELLWWREEFKDISTRFYHLIRQATRQLGEKYQEQGILQHAEQLFYLEKEQTQAFMHHRISAAELQQLAQDNFAYCQAYRAFNPPGDLLAQVEADDTFVQGKATRLSGIGANDGIVSGKVRVLLDPKDVDQLQADEILVTRFTDTGWSHAFGTIQGLITETGGVLCHASIVAREFGIPVVVCAEGATKQLKTGMEITINGTTGEIMI